MLLLKNAFKQGFAVAKPSLAFSVFSKSAISMVSIINENPVMQHKTLHFTPSAGIYLPAAAKSSLFAKKYKSGRPKNSKRGKFSRKRIVKRLIRDHRPANHNGLLARIRIVGPRHARRFKCRPAGSRHLLRNKSKNNLRRRKKVKYISEADMPRMKKLIPYFKRQKLKRMH